MSTPADIAELHKALERCCADLAAALEVSEAAAEAAAAQRDADHGIEPVEGGPQWRPLILATIPGLDTLVSIVKPPLQVIIALLQVIAALLEALAAILIGLPDILRALIMAAYALLRDIINDLLNTGAYMYLDVPGITPRESSIRETGLFIDPIADWKAGRAAGPPPVTPDGWSRWASRFARSFDDPGDLQRPVVTDGAPIQAIFIVAAAPSLDAIAQFLYLLGKLLNIDKFKLAIEKYQNVPDPRRTRAKSVNSVPPDWKAIRLRDIFPALEGLMMIPEALKGLLSAVDNLSALIKNLAAAMQDKANLLLQMAAAIQAILDLLDALKSTGFYSLGVATQGGVAGLQNAFMTASNRPPGGYIGGVCFMASGPNLAKAAMLFDLLGGTTAIELMEGDLTLSQVGQQIANSAGAQVLEGAYDSAKVATDKFAATTKEAAEDFVKALEEAEKLRPDLAAALGTTWDELKRDAATMRVAAVEALEQADVWIPNKDKIEQAIAQTKQAQRHGARSLALGYGSKEPDNLLRDDTDPKGAK
jgi:hypothetical protein